MRTTDTENHAPVSESGVSRWDMYGVALMLMIGLTTLIPLSIAFWPQFPILLLLIGLGVLGGRGYMAFEHHRLDIAIKRNQAYGFQLRDDRVVMVHDAEQGFGYLGPGGVVQGYSHTMSGMPPFDPALLGMGMGEPEQHAKYPKTFTEMLKGGYVAPGADLVVAFEQETGEPIRLPNPTSTGMSGLPGAGKTVTTSLLMMEMIAKWNGRVRFLVVDPHMEVEGDESLLSKIEPLGPYFLSLAEVASTVSADDQLYRSLLELHSDLPAIVSGGPNLGAWMDIVAVEMERRKHGKTGDVWVIVIDEFAAVMDGPQSKQISKVVASINREARKMGMYALVISQDWKASTAGGTDIRQSIPAFVIHNTASQVVGLFAPQDIARQAEGLEVGQVIVRTRGKSLIGRVPMVTEYDAQKLMELYPPVTSRVQISEVRDSSGRLDDGKGNTARFQEREPTLLGPAPVDGSYTELSDLASGQVTQTEGIPDWIDQQTLEEVRDLFGEGWNAPDIAKRVYRVKSGPDLAEARIKVDRAIRWVVANGR